MSVRESFPQTVSPALGVTVGRSAIPGWWRWVGQGPPGVTQALSWWEVTPICSFSAASNPSLWPATGTVTLCLHPPHRGCLLGTPICLS